MIDHKISEEFPLVLASASPRRKRLLEQVGIPIRVRPSHIEESGVEGVDPEKTVEELAVKKAMGAKDLAEAEGLWVLGADTVVVLGNSVLGKPADAEDARTMLSRLSDREHKVITGFCILSPGTHRGVFSSSVTTHVKIKELSPREIEAYIATGEPFDKAGSYGIQGIGAFMVESITGSYTNVVGLPICAVIKALVALGAVKTFPFGKMERAGSLEENERRCP